MLCRSLGLPGRSCRASTSRAEIGGVQSDLQRCLNWDPRQILGLQIFAEELTTASLHPCPEPAPGGRTVRRGREPTPPIWEAASPRLIAGTIAERFVLPKGTCLHICHCGHQMATSNLKMKSQPFVSVAIANTSEPYLQDCFRKRLIGKTVSAQLKVWLLGNST